MRGKILIVEDEALTAMDLKAEAEEYDCQVVGIAETAEEAMTIAEIFRPDLALMDINIIGHIDGIQTAGLLRNTYGIPVVFLTSYSDEATLRRASAEIPYGYLTKPYSSPELKATLLTSLHRAQVDAAERTANQNMAAAVQAMQEGLLTVSLDGTIQLMNAAAARLTGLLPMQAKGKQIHEVLKFREGMGIGEISALLPDDGKGILEFGWTMPGPARVPLQVEIALAPLLNNARDRTGFVLTLRESPEHQASDEDRPMPPAKPAQQSEFEHSSTCKVLLDARGRVTRANKALLEQYGLQESQLLGRSITELSQDPDPKISTLLVPRLLIDAAHVEHIR